MSTQAGTNELKGRADNKQVLNAPRNTTKRAFGKKGSSIPVEISEKASAWVEVGDYNLIMSCKLNYGGSGRTVERGT